MTQFKIGDRAVLDLDGAGTNNCLVEITGFTSSLCTVRFLEIPAEVMQHYPDLKIGAKQHVYVARLSSVPPDNNTVTINKYHIINLATPYGPCQETFSSFELAQAFARGLDSMAPDYKGRESIKVFAFAEVDWKRQ